MRRLLKFVTIFIVLVTFCSCGESDTTVVKESIPTTVSKLAKTNSFDTLIVIKDEEYIHFYEQGDYKSSIPLKDDDHGGLIVIGMVLGAVIAFAITGIFSD